MKHYTTIEQSKKLLELGLNPESADMCYVIDYAESNKWGKDKYNLQIDTYGLMVQQRDNIPCWSMEALLDILPKTIIVKGYTISLFTCGEYFPVDSDFKYYIQYLRVNGVEKGDVEFETTLCDTLFDAVYSMEVMLLEQQIH